MAASSSDSMLASYVAHYRKYDDAWQRLLDHLFGAAYFSRIFAIKIGLPRLGELLGLLHDLGKYSAEFQRYLKSAIGALDPDLDAEWVDAVHLKGTIDHATAGAQWTWNSLGSQKNPMARLAGQLAAICIASHHSGLIDCLTAGGEDKFLQRMGKEDYKSNLAEACRVADEELLNRATALIEDPELVAEVQRIWSSIELKNKEAVPRLQQYGLLARFSFSCLIAGDRIDTANFENPGHADLRPSGDKPDWPTLIGRLEQHLAMFPSRHPIDELRKSISQECKQAASFKKGIYQLTVPTGGGKTLASLRFALHHAHQLELDHVIYVIPFTSIIDQNAQVVRSILEPPDAPRDAGRMVLEHHSNITPERQTWREKIISEDWNAPVVYTTMVQLLETLFGSGTRGARKMHQLANSVLVFDEVQTLPIRCVHLFNNAINFLVEQCGSTVVLCTATQPLLDKVAPEKGAIRLAETHDLISNVDLLFDKLRRVDVRDDRKPGGWILEEIANLSVERFSSEGNCLVITNTKASARKLFDLAEAVLPPDTVYHLSTSMCPAHRKAVLNTVRQRLDAGMPVLCISTQLIEAGVDVDFRAVVRFLAGLDSMAQAAGRCNRNGNSRPGTLYIVNPQNESLSYLPDIAEGRRQAERVLDHYREHPEDYCHNLVGPMALTEYYRYYFFERKQDMVYPIPAKEVGVSTSLLEMLSKNTHGVNGFKDEHEQMPPSFPFRQPFMTAARLFKAIDAPTEGIVVPYGQEGEELIKDLCEAFDLSLAPQLLRKTQQYTVNVFPRALSELAKRGAFKTIHAELRIHCLLPEHYSHQFGLTNDHINLKGAHIWGD